MTITERPQRSPALGAASRPATAAARLDVTPAVLRGLALSYERHFGPLPRDGSVRLWPPEAIERLALARERVRRGEARTLDAALAAQGSAHPVTEQARTHETPTRPVLRDAPPEDALAARRHEELLHAVAELGRTLRGREARPPLGDLDRNEERAEERGETDVTALRRLVEEQGRELSDLRGRLRRYQQDEFSRRVLAEIEASADVAAHGTRRDVRAYLRTAWRQMLDRVARLRPNGAARRAGGPSADVGVSHD